jgi:transposase-like protein
MMQMSKPRPPRIKAESNEVRWFEDDERLNRLYNYCREDVETTRELHQRLRRISPEEHRLWSFDAQINARGFHVDRELAEAALRTARVAQQKIDAELDLALSRPRYARRAKPPNDAAAGGAAVIGHRHGHRSRSLLGSFGRVEIAVPRARLSTAGKTTEWNSKALQAYQRRTLVAEALIASSYLAGTNTRRVSRALAALFGGAVGKDTVSRVWRKVKTDWDAWNSRSLTDEPIVRLILDGTAVRVRLDRKATSISLLVVIGVREDGQKVLLAIKSMGGESTEAWRTVLDDLIKPPACDTVRQLRSIGAMQLQSR